MDPWSPDSWPWSKRLAAQSERRQLGRCKSGGRFAKMLWHMKRRIDGSWPQPIFFLVFLGPKNGFDGPTVISTVPVGRAMVQTDTPTERERDGGYRWRRTWQWKSGTLPARSPW